MAEEHARAFVDIPEAKLVGIFSRTKEKAQSLAATHKMSVVADSVKELYEKTQADLVVVTVFETAMFGIIHEALKHPWALLVEKPPGYTLNQSLELEKVAREASRTVYVGLNRRLLSSTCSVMDSLTEQAASPRFVHVQDQQSLSLARSIGHPEDVVAHWRYANSIHLVDYLIYFCRGKVSRVDVSCPWKGDSTALVHATVHFSSGDIGIYQAIWQGPGPWAVATTTSTTRWELRPLESAAFCTVDNRKLQSVPTHDWDARFKPGFRLQAQRAFESLKGDQPLLPSLSEACRTMKLIHSIYGC